MAFILAWYIKNDISFLFDISLVYIYGYIAKCRLVPVWSLGPKKFSADPEPSVLKFDYLISQIALILVY